MAAGDDRGAVDIGQGAGDAQHPVIAPRGQAQPFGRPGEERAARLLRRSDLVEQRAVSIGIGADAALGRQRRVSAVWRARATRARSAM